MLYTWFPLKGMNGKLCHVLMVHSTDSLANDVENDVLIVTWHEKGTAREEAGSRRRKQEEDGRMNEQISGQEKGTSRISALILF